MQINSNKKKIFCWKTFGWASLVVFVIFLLLSFPVFFNFFAIHFWHVPKSELSDYTKLGPIGDIYGSLNTIFTSATLAFVVYATLLQRQANKDAREAMKKQLQQASEDTKKQLEQAREATEKQIFHAKELAEIQLKQTMDVSTKQLELSQATHNEQIKESQTAIFNNKFFSFLKFKKENLEGLNFYLLEMDDGYRKVKAESLLVQLANQIISHLKTNSIDIENADKKSIERFFLTQCNAYFDDFKNSTLYSYFLNYKSLINMVFESDLNIDEKKEYFRIISNSMSYEEQVVLFFIGPTYSVFMDFMKNSEIFIQFSGEDFNGFAKKFYDVSYFASPYWKHHFKNKFN